VSVRTFAVLLLALIFGGSAAWMVSSILKFGPGGPAGDTVPVVMAVVDIPRGATISKDLIKLRDWPKDDVPAGALNSVEDAVDRAVAQPLVKGELVIDGKLANKGAGRGLAALIPTGMRAFTIQTPNIATGVAGFILPGNRVDVLLTVTNTSGMLTALNGQNDETGGGTTTTLLQNVEILAVDQRVDAPADNKVDPKDLRSVTLLVTPDQAAKLTLGADMGKLHLSLRAREDNQAAQTQPETLKGIRGYQDPPRDTTAQVDQVKQLREAMEKMMRENPLADKVKELQETIMRMAKERAQQPPVPAAPPTIRALKGTYEQRVPIEPPFGR
jgi:pilus assembly protein CpaB